jgi:homoserine kinase type II
MRACADGSRSGSRWVCSVRLTAVEVLARWGLGDAAIEKVESGATNETWRVSSDDRVRYLRRSRTIERSAVQREHDLINHVADAGVRTPQPIATDDNETVVDLNGALFSLFDTAEGQQLEPCDLSVEHAASAGAFLARVHTAAASVDISGFRELTLRWDGPAWVNRVRATAEIIPQDSSSDVDRWAYQRSVEQAEWLDDPSCRHSYTPAAATQVIHGDYQHANLFFTGTEVAAVIDWDTAVVATRGFEIVRACSFMFHLDNDRTSSFLSGYRTVSPLSSEELDDGARAWGCFADHHVWPTEERYRHGNRAAERFIPHRPFQPFEQIWVPIQHGST